MWLERREKDPVTKGFWQRGLVLLDGSDLRFAWQPEDGARDPGVVSFARLPQIKRRDYVFNANDSHWVAHAEARLPDSLPLTGEEETPLSLRSRMNADTGYPITGGTSFIMVLDYTDAGPDAQAILTYSQSGDPSSPHFADQTERFSNKQWRPILFAEDQISADPELEEITIRGD